MSGHRHEEKDRVRDSEKTRHHHSNGRRIHRLRRHSDRSKSPDRNSDRKHRHHHHHHRRHHSDRDRDSDRGRDRHRRSRHDKSRKGERSSKQEVVDEDEHGEWVIDEDTGPLDENDFDQEKQPVRATTSEHGNDMSKLNKLKAEIYKAEMKGDTDKVAELNGEYVRLSGVPEQERPEKSNVKVIDQRFLPSAKSKSDEDPSVQDMLREEIETRGQDQFGKKMAQEISKDGTFANDNDYQDDMAEKLAKVAGDKDQAVKSRAIAKTQKLNQYIDDCWLCTESKDPQVTIISMATRTYLCMPPEPEIARGTCVIAPTDHRMNMLECDEDEWEEVRNFMKCITNMWADLGKSVIFYESAANRTMKRHATIFAVPMPHSLLDSAPGYFHQAFLEYAAEWSNHKAVIDTGNKGRNGFQSSIAKEAPYFHVWFDINGGMGHIVESEQWPKGDRFARQVLGGMLNADLATSRKRGEWVADPNSKQAQYFKQRWQKYDWTDQIPED